MPRVKTHYINVCRSLRTWQYGGHRDKICEWLNLDKNWQIHEVPGGYSLPEIRILFERIDKDTVGTEVDRLKGCPSDEDPVS